MVHRSLVSTLLVVMVVAFARAQETAKPESPAYQVPDAFSDRVARKRLKSNGGDDKTEAAVMAGLGWLARHQSEAGFWDSDGFGRQCRSKTCKGPGRGIYDRGTTGLALLAFLGAGKAPGSTGYGEVVKKGIDWLIGNQDPEGLYGEKRFQNYVYTHAIATLAVTEAYALTGDPKLRKSAERGIDYIEKARNPGLAWRYSIRPHDNDTSVTGWMVSALHVANLSGLETDPQALDGARVWLRRITNPKTGETYYDQPGTTAARPTDLMDSFPREYTESLTAVGVLLRLLTASDLKKAKRAEIVVLGAERCLALPPRWEPAHVDMYYWYYGSQAMFRLGGKYWRTWNKTLKKTLLPNQQKVGCARGSWDPAGPWGRDGGRVYSTALCTMMLESYYRYQR